MQASIKGITRGDATEYKYKVGLTYFLSPKTRRTIKVPINAFLQFEPDEKFIKSENKTDSKNDTKSIIKFVKIPIGAFPQTKFIDDMIIKNPPNNPEFYHVRIGTPYSYEDLCDFARFVLGGVGDMYDDSKRNVFKTIIESLGILFDTYNPDKYLQGKLNERNKIEQKLIINKMMTIGNQRVLKKYANTIEINVKYTKNEIKMINDYDIDVGYIGQMIHDETIKKYKLLKNSKKFNCYSYKYEKNGQSIEFIPDPTSKIVDTQVRFCCFQKKIYVKDFASVGIQHWIIKDNE